MQVDRGGSTLGELWRSSDIPGVLVGVDWRLSSVGGVRVVHQKLLSVPGGPLGGGVRHVGRDVL